MVLGREQQLENTLSVGADLLWSTELSNKVAIEYGAGAGIGWVFGDLSNNWVQLEQQLGRSWPAPACTTRSAPA